jgi:ergothioneine biosynthesis protein EgtB
MTSTTMRQEAAPAERGRRGGEITAGDPNALTTLAERFQQVRRHTRSLAEPITAEDAMVQSMPDASPTKWHLGHTTWFFERFLLRDRLRDRPRHPNWDVLFNSYYQSVDPMHSRPQRGLLSRPCLAEVLGYREEIDDVVIRALDAGALDGDARMVLELGLHHEQQHQELILTDIKHALFGNPLRPAYSASTDDVRTPAGDQGWQSFDDAVVEIGAPACPSERRGFAYDNESPRHRVLVAAFALAERPVTSGEYLDFVADGGYRTASLWLSEGWAMVQNEGWARPLYWLDEASEFTLMGARPIDRDAPVCHLSYYEADAFARWADARLPTEFEWERAAASPAGGVAPATASTVLHPRGIPGCGLRQMSGSVWQWTSSAYGAYAGFRPMPGSLGEYNGKFMCSQWVLRGGSFATPDGHTRITYRNFFPPPTRWQFTGVRLAKDVP